MRERGREHQDYGTVLHIGRELAGARAKAFSEVITRNFGLHRCEFERCMEWCV